MYNEIADKIGEFIASNGHALVFGGCSMGLMGRVYSKAKSGGAKVIATQAKVYADELEGVEAYDVKVLDTINDRKNCYKRCADVLVFIPGGIGTLDEFIDALETRRAGEHLCPMLIVNADGLYDGVLDTLDRMYKENLASYGTRELYHAVHTADEAIDFLNQIRV
ncbi:MAG: LOG family protein [Clostridia bacterium]|nr:LOG family protein [Clostridia bacterium]